MRYKNPLFAETEDIISVLQAGEKQDIVILIIPSHDKDEKPIKNQDVWAGEAMELIKDLYGGATAFMTFAGIYLTDDGRTLHDKTNPDRVVRIARGSRR